MRLLFSPSFGQHLLSVQDENYGLLQFKTKDGYHVKIGSPLSSGMYYLDLQRNESVPDELLSHVAAVSHSCFVNANNIPKREIGEYRYKTAVAIVTNGVPPKGDKLAGYYCYHMEFNGKSPEDVRELEKRFFLGTIMPYKIAGEQPKTFKEALELFLREHSPKKFFERLRLCVRLVFKKPTP